MSREQLSELHDYLLVSYKVRTFDLGATSANLACITFTLDCCLKYLLL